MHGKKDKIVPFEMGKIYNFPINKFNYFNDYESYSYFNVNSINSFINNL